MKNALLSVSDKTGLIEFATFLIHHDYTLYATGNTYNVLNKAKILVHKVEDLTHYPEMMEGRVKTLHPVIHGGILGKRDSATHQKNAHDFNMPWIDLVVVNLYPFIETMLDSTKTDDEIIEQIDIGGPALIRSAAKNHAYVSVLVDPIDYTNFMKEISSSSETSLVTRRMLAKKAFRHTAQYDALIAEYFNEEAFPETLSLTYKRQSILRYGENPHQDAAFYINPLVSKDQLKIYEPFHGKPLSYNNIIDIDAALNLLNAFNVPTAVAVKHTNPCGVASASTILKAFKKAYEADPVSIFGGIVAFNDIVEEELASILHTMFLEIIIAKDFTSEARALLTKKKNIRLIKVNDYLHDQYTVKSVNHGVLIQSCDSVNTYKTEVLTKLKPNEEDIKELLFAYKIVKAVKSNAIVVSKDLMTLGIGAGQMNRVGATSIALNQAGNKAQQAYLASDGFFPMPDSIELAHTFKIKAIIQPAGSIKDQAVIDACDKYGIIMVKTSTRHFKH